MKTKLSLGLLISFFVVIFCFTSCTDNMYPKSTKDAGVNNAEAIGSNEIDFENIKKSNIAYSALYDRDGNLIGYELTQIVIDEDEIIEELTLPSTNNGLPVLGIGIYGANSLNKVKKIIIPDSYIYLGEGAFSYSVDLEEVVLPNSLIHYAPYPFGGCYALKNVKLPDNMTTVPANFFSYCNGINNIILPSSVTTIEKGAFYECFDLNNIVIPEGVTRIEKEAFARCSFTNLEFLPSTIEYIEGGAFSYFETSNGDRNWKIEEIRLPKSLKRIEDESFNGFHVLESVEIHSGIEEIGESSFNNNRILSSLAIILTDKNELNIKSIGSDSFLNCPKLQKVTLVYSSLETEDNLDEFKENIESQFKALLNSVESSGLKTLDIEFININDYLNPPTSEEE